MGGTSKATLTDHTSTRTGIAEGVGYIAITVLMHVGSRDMSPVQAARLLWARLQDCKPAWQASRKQAAVASVHSGAHQGFAAQTWGCDRSPMREDARQGQLAVPAAVSEQQQATRTCLWHLLSIIYSNPFTRTHAVSGQQ
jgi:hypothetical protein